MKKDELHVEKTNLDNLLLIKPLSFFEDFRGDYVETYNFEAYQKSGIDANFVQDDYATSSQNVLRGLHGDPLTSKLVSCLQGELHFVAVNFDKSSKQFLKWQSFQLNDKNRHQIYVPENFAIGYFVKSKIAIFHYKQTTYYYQSKQFTLRWDDPKLQIDWPTKRPKLSSRDRSAIFLS